MSPGDVRLIEKVCDRFEAAWRAGQRPELSAYLEDVAAATCPALLEHLIALDWEYRIKAGEKPRAEDYESRFPEASALIEAIRREAAAETRKDGRSPQQLGEYRILRQAGRGGMGTVYEAVHEVREQRVALKLLPGVDLADPKARERFWREAHTTARLSHPNIVPIIEVGEHEGQLFLALEFIAGPSLSDQLRKSPLPPRQAASIVEVVARAVHYAHQQGIIHRDLKPANVLLSRDEKDARAEGTEFTPKVTDFGLAHPLNGSELTATGEIVGTPGYMAPEQAWGKGQRHVVGPETDVYALGAVLYASLTGRPPFQGVTALDALAKIRTDDPLPPSRLQPHVPRDLETICLRCLEKEPLQRYATAESLGNDLRRFLDGKLIAARRPSTAQRLARWCARNPAFAAASILAVVALAAGVGMAVNWAGRIRLRREQALTETALYDARTQRARAELNADQLSAQQGLTKAALVQAETFRQQAELLSVTFALERGLALLEQGDLAKGMLVLGHSLQIAPADATDLTHTIRYNLAAARGRLTYELAEILKHKGEVQSAAFSPDGKVLLTGGRLSGAQRWDAATGEPLGEQLPHGGEIRAVAYSADGSLIITASTDKTARLWDTATGEPVGKPFKHAHWVMCAAISPDNKTVLTGSADGTAGVWNVETGEQRGDLRPPGWVQAVAFSPDGKILATGSGNNGQLWHTDTLEPIGDLLRHKGEIFATTFSPDGKLLLTGSLDGVVRMWEADSGKPTGLPLVHQGAVHGIAYSRDGSVLITGSADGKVRFWDGKQFFPLGPALQHQTAVYALALSPDQQRLVTGSSDGKVRIWESPPAKTPDMILPHQRLAYCVAISPDGKTIATGSADPQVRLWDAATGKQIGTPLKHPNSIFRVGFSPDGKTLLTACSDNTARLWDVESHQALAPVLKHTNHVYAVAFSPDGKTIVTGAKDSTARLWDAATGEPLTEPLAHAGWVHAAAFSPDGKTFLTGCEDATARLWDTATGKQIGEPLVHRGPVRAAAFSPDGRLILTGTWDDGTARLWDAETRQPLGPPLPHQEHVITAAFSPDGKTVATGAWNGMARLWDVATGKRLGLPLMHQRTVRDVVFTPDGKQLLTASFDRSVRAWELPIATADDADQEVLKIQVLTGMELDTDGLFRDLDAATWRERRAALNKRRGVESSNRAQAY